MNSYVVAGLAAKSLRENHEVAQQLAQLEEMREKVDYQMLEIYNLIDEVKRFETHEEYGKVARQLARRWQIVRERAQKNRKTSPKRSMSMSRNFHDKRAPRRENEGHNRPGRGAPRRNDSKTSFRKCSPLRDPGPDLCDSSVSILSTASDFPPGYNSSAPRKGILKPPKEPPNNEGGLTYQTNFTWKSPPIVPKSDGMTDVPFAPTHEKVIVIPPEKSPDALATPFRTGLSVEEWRNTFASMKNLPETRPSSALNPRDPRLSRGSHSVTTAPSSSATSEGGYGSANRPISQGPLLSTPVNVTPSASITSENGYRNLNRPVQQVPPSGTNYPPSPSVTPKKNFASYNRSLKQMPPAGPVNVNTASSTASKNSFGAFNSPAEPSTIESLGTIKLGSSGGQSFPGNKWNGRQNGPNFRVPGGPMNRPPHFKKRLAHPSGPGGPSNPAPKPRINIGFKIPFVMPDTSRPPPPITRPVKHLAPVKQYYHEVAKPDSPSTPVGVVPYRPNRTPAKKNIKMDVSPSDSVPVVKEETDSDGEIFDVENDDVKVVVSESVTLSLPPIQLEVPVAPSLVVHKEPVTAVKTVPPLVLSGIFKRAPPAGLKRIPKLQKVRPSIPRLYDLCEKACEKSARGSYYGRVPFHLLAPLLEKYSTKALYEVEITMPWLEDEINGIWMKRLRANFPAVKHFPGESFGQAYRRCVEELEDETTEKLIRSVMEARMKPKIKGPKKAPVRRKRQRNPPGAPRQKGKRAAPCT